MKTQRQTYTVHEMAEMLGVGRNSVYEGVKNKGIPHRRCGRRILFPIAMVQNWLEGQEEQA